MRMAFTRQRSEWVKTAQLCHVIYCMNAGERASSKDVEDFMPAAYVE